MSLFVRLGLVCLLGMAWGGQASAQQIGTAYDAIRSRYAEARLVRLDGGRRALELVDIDHGGVRWSKIDFIFGPGDRLTNLTLSTRRASYSDVLKLAQQTIAETGTRRNAALESAGEDMQLRVCDSGDGEITLTYEALSSEG